MLACAVCSTDLHGHYEFHTDGSTMCMTCFDALPVRPTASAPSLDGEVDLHVEQPRSRFSVLAWIKRSLR